VLLVDVQNRLQRLGAGAGERSIPLVRSIRLLLAAACLLVPASSAAAAPVLVLDGGRVTREHDPFVPAATGPVPSRPPAARAAGAGSVRRELAALLASGQIAQAEHDERVKDYDDALFVRNQLAGTPRRELSGVLSNLAGIAARRELTRTRLEVLWLQLNRNVEWWALASRVPGRGERVRFEGSRVLFQYVPGQGLQFHPLANWGRVSGLVNGGYVANAQEMVAELTPLASDRGGALAWEYFFHFGGGRPPWTSGLSQGTALVALARTYGETGEAAYLATLRRAVGLYALDAPLGVRVRTRRGNHYAEYSFAPRLRIINGFVQALNGLFDAGRLDGRARRLFLAGDRRARYELPRYDTGRWSRYSNARGSLSTVNYHVLLRDFLRGLCQRTGTRLYCSTAARFTRYLAMGPPRRAR
jgi:hypothetical protein